MGIDFLGNKEQLLPFLYTHISEETAGLPGPVGLVDLFCGAGAVSRCFKSHGCRVTANDFLTCCAVMTKAILLNDGAPEFRGLREAAPEIFAGESTRSPYERVLAYLNRLEGREGFIYGNYSPASLEQCEYERMYFTR